MFSRLCAPSWRSAQTEIARGDLRTGRHQHAALDGMLELAHVARPRMAQQRVHRRAVESGQVLAIAARMLFEEMQRERGDVVAAIAQRRK